MKEEFWRLATIDAVQKYNSLPRFEKPRSIPNDALPMPSDTPLEQVLPFGTVGFIKNKNLATKLSPRGIKARYLCSDGPGTYFVLISESKKIIRCLSQNFKPYSLIASLQTPGSLRQAKSLKDAPAWMKARDDELRRYIVELKHGTTRRNENMTFQSQLLSSTSQKPMKTETLRKGKHDAL